MNDQPKVLCIGCGNMGAAILMGIANKYPAATLVAVDPSVDRARSVRG